MRTPRVTPWVDTASEPGTPIKWDDCGSPALSPFSPQSDGQGALGAAATDDYNDDDDDSSAGAEQPPESSYRSPVRAVVAAGVGGVREADSPGLSRLPALPPTSPA